MKQLIVISLIMLVGVMTGYSQEADILKSDAIIMESQMQYLKAAELYEQAAIKYDAEQKSDAFMYFKAGQCYNRVKRYDNALPLLNEAKQNGYDEVDLYISLGDAYVGKKDYKQAEEALLKGREKDEERELDINKKLAFTYLNSKQYEKSVEVINAGLAVEPNDVSLLYYLGSSYQRLKKYPEACESLERVLEVDPNHKNATKMLGVLYFKLTDHKYNVETKRYEALKNPSRVDYHNSTKKMEQISKGYSKSLPYLEKAHSNSPKDKSIISCLNVAYRRLKMENKADEMSQLLD
ncbi:tetratricopeptide repeat protein [Carboxylicivirga sp. N1Y90]|uniref:tetratricopeptide repeat protein n=1 Tax=Carboxylicivirga fragile TaxID=3417571 RepID=UPI003D341D85|nr:tetratricopeptide repeat protein [Marinilabiliaceae bacterium N1Y90]